MYFCGITMKRNDTMNVNRSTPPEIRPLGEFQIARPERMQMKNGMPLNIIRAGSQEVVRMDILIGGGKYTLINA